MTRFYAIKFNYQEIYDHWRKLSDNDIRYDFMFINPEHCEDCYCVWCYIPAPAQQILKEMPAAFATNALSDEAKTFLHVWKGMIEQAPEDWDAGIVEFSAQQFATALTKRLKDDD